MGEGEPGADGGQDHSGRPADVQRSRRRNTTGDAAGIDQDKHLDLRKNLKNQV